MQTVNSVDAKNSFGKVVMKAQSEPVCISKNGQAVAVMMSMDEYESIQSLREQLLHQRLDKALDDVQAGRVRDGLEVHEDMRKKYFNGQV
ncbi:type II toxin-antitoxin system Phd/YefM family antitoxin [Porticoccus sp. W117]|uniref:type II toxin-antitoxin system Phd/YefM family antitoxin n=1 Tax=Porticoccus sp. W117 TaxID=3054777 RepID=UPI002597E782|nr:type II toxin-antitoxin system Phd/YefM family antitoxin [Porticoccus sp. W117]MDM3870168.1 type II toxin-antitoxin system Phd/YefM family antitoxin [Porticoccus sp. W117]